MGKLIRIFAVGAVLFGASLGASWFFFGRETEESDSGNASADGGGVQSPLDEEDFPVAVRPRTMTPEELVVYSSRLQSREQAIDARAASLERKEAELQLVTTDVLHEQAEVETLHAGVQSTLNTLEELLQKLNDERQRFEQERSAASDELQTIQLARLDLQQDEQKNMKELAEAMDPSTAAVTIRNFINDGDIELAVELLANYEERDAAEILEKLSVDEELLSELIRKYIRRSRPEPPQKKR